MNRIISYHGTKCGGSRLATRPLLFVLVFGEQGCCIDVGDGTDDVTGGVGDFSFMGLPFDSFLTLNKGDCDVSNVDGGCFCCC
jgi:hypothetical protein